MPDELRYRPELPWIGPGVGAPHPPPPPSRTVTGGAMPALGAPMVVVFIPVITAANGHFVAADAKGKESTVEQAGWTQACPTDNQGLFRIEVPADRWNGEFEGILVLLIY